VAVAPHTGWIRTFDCTGDLPRADAFAHALGKKAAVVCSYFGADNAAWMVTGGTVGPPGGAFDTAGMARIFGNGALPDNWINPPSGAPFIDFAALPMRTGANIGTFVVAGAAAPGGVVTFDGSPIPAGSIDAGGVYAFTVPLTIGSDTFALTIQPPPEARPARGQGPPIGRAPAAGRSPGLDSVDRAVLALEADWERGDAPSPERLRDRLAPGASPMALAALIEADLRHRFDRGERPAVADYLDRFPELREEAERVVSLVYEEYCLLEERGERPDPDEFCTRYAPWQDSLQSQLRYHRVLSQAVTPSALPRFPELGERFGTFRLRSILGQGGAARVYLAQDDDLGGAFTAIVVAAGSGPVPLGTVQSAVDGANLGSTDFGLTKRVERECELTKTGAIVGTPSYVPPERVFIVGLYSVPVSAGTLGAANYHSPGLVGGSLTVTAASLIVVDSKTWAYGQPNPGFIGSSAECCSTRVVGDPPAVGSDTTTGCSTISDTVNVEALAAGRAHDYSVTVPGSGESELVGVGGDGESGLVGRGALRRRRRRRRVGARRPGRPPAHLYGRGTERAGDSHNDRHNLQSDGASTQYTADGPLLGVRPRRRRPKHRQDRVRPRQGRRPGRGRRFRRQEEADRNRQ
jgi:hypothetical protein